ncbi:obg [Symbiodinium sp. KB8]|nr:obg [Symbiodinium sp. KB8]
MASTDVIVLSVKVAKQRKPRPAQLRKAVITLTWGTKLMTNAQVFFIHQGLRTPKLQVNERGDPGKASDTKREVKETQAMKKEVKDEEAATREQVKEEIAQKDMKKEAKEEASKDEQMDVKTEIKKEVSKNMSQEVKEEMPQKDMKQEVKEEVRPEMKPQIGDEVVRCRRRLRTKVKAEIKHEVKQEDHDWQCRVTCVKRELVHEEEQVCVKEEHAEQAGPIQEAKRRRISQKKSEAAVPSFESRMTEWAEKCLAFQSSGKTWLPTKPCCPASPFLGLAGAPWQGCARDKTTACVQLLDKDQFRELRDFYRENPHHALFHDSSDASSGRQTETTVVSRLQAHRSSTGNQHRAAECMKMWPWMRDLPTRAWAGNGWLLVEDGMMKLSPTGGGSAMQGLEIFESVGSVPEPGEPKSSEQSSLAEPRAEQSQVFTKSFRGLERQSGIQGIIWKREMACWRVQWPEAGKQKQLHFPISKHMKLGLSEAEALEAALEEAKAFLEELVRQGKLKPSTEKTGGSAVRGVKYVKKTGNWRAELVDPSTHKKVHGGMFKVKEEAEARAREMFQKFWDEHHEVVPVKPLSELPNFEPLGPEKGIRWSQQTWHAQIDVAGERRDLRVRPKDFSPKEVEKAWKQAVAWRQQQLKEKERIAQPQKRKR